MPNASLTYKNEFNLSQLTTSIWQREWILWEAPIDTTDWPPDGSSAELKSKTMHSAYHERWDVTAWWLPANYSFSRKHSLFGIGLCFDTMYTDLRFAAPTYASFLEQLLAMDTKLEHLLQRMELKSFKDLHHLKLDYLFLYYRIDPNLDDNHDSM